MTRILLLSEIYPPATGGSGRWFSEIYPKLTLQNANCLVNAHTDATKHDEMFAGGKVQRADLTMRDRAPFSLASARRYLEIYNLVKRAAKHGKYNQLHAARPLFEGLVCFAVAKRLRIPYACYVHGEDVSVARTSRQLKLVTKKVLNAASLIICNSKFSKEMLLNEWNIPNSSIAVIHPGVDTNYFVPETRNNAARAQLGWADRPVILTVGRLQRRKGQDNFIRSLSYTKTKIPNVLYAIVGDGPTQEHLRTIAQENKLENHVTFHGEVSDEMIRTCYQQCDLFSLPNRTDGADVEGFGMVSLEAQACGKAALVGNSGGTPETVIDNVTGSVIDCTEPRSISHHTLRLLSDNKSLANMGRDARARAVRDFDWQAVTKKSSQIFENLSD